MIPVNTRLMVQYCLNSVLIRVVMDKKRVFIRYLIGQTEFEQRANFQDFFGPFTTSCEAQTRIVSQRRANTVIGGST